MNPRHRRLVIPVALAGLLVIVVVAAVFDDRNERTPPAGARPDARPPARPRHPGARGRVRPAEGHPAARGGGSSCGTSTSRPGATCRSRRTTTPRRTPPTTPAGDDAAETAVDDLLDEPFGNWHVETTTADPPGAGHQEARGGRAHAPTGPSTVEVDRGHDRDKERLLPEDDPVLRGARHLRRDRAGSSRAGRRSTARSRSSCGCSTRRSPTRIDKGHLRRPTAEEPLRIVDLGCGNAYLTFAAHRFLTAVRGLPVRLTGVDVQGAVARPQQRGRRARSASTRSSWSGRSRAPQLDLDPEVVLALHACDTATDEALARAVEWQAAAGAGRALLPPRHRGPAAPQPDARAVRHAHPARHPARAVRRHPDRRAAGIAAAAAGLPRRRDAVRREPAHAAQHHAARGPHRCAGEGRRRAQGVRRAGGDLGGAAAAGRAAGAAGAA